MGFINRVLFPDVISETGFDQAYEILTEQKRGSN
jgi:hypothetical protein